MNSHRNSIESDSDALASHAPTPQAPSLILSGELGLTPTEIAEVQPHFLVGNPHAFGDFDLIEQIGSGGSGVVFRAKNRRSKEVVAIKVLKPAYFANEQFAKRFEKEARMHGQISSPHIPKQISYGQIGSLFYLVSELVDGLDLQRILKTEKKLEPVLSMRIIADLLKGLIAMHDHSMVHRDVKPGNVIACFKNVRQRRSVSNFQCAKLTDFGLAREIDQSESLEITQQVCIGTPWFQAPEQFIRNESIAPTVDIYSVGATLFYMLTGRPPFECSDILELAQRHRNEVPPKLSNYDHRISGAISTIVAKALEKNPAMRFQNASEMAREVHRVLDQQPLSISNLSSKHGNKRYKHFVFDWDLDCSLNSLWPLVADTDRFNRAIDLPAPDFRFEEINGERRLIATAKFKGMNVRWHEHPFEWIEGREMSVLREFDSGPFVSVRSHVELSPLSHCRTRLTHRFEVVPRGIMGQIISWFQFKISTFTSIDRAYRKMEWIAQQQEINPFACDMEFASRKLNNNQTNLNLLSNRLQEVPTQLDGACLDRLREYLIHSSDAAVSRIRPKVLARRLDCSLEELLEFGLRGSQHGLFSLLWDVICPTCRIASNSFSSIHEIEQHQRCEACDAQFEVDFAQFVELVFRIHPDIRRADTSLYCIGGPFHSPHVAAQLNVYAGQNSDVEIANHSDTKLLVRGPTLPHVHQLIASEEGAVERVALDLLKPAPQPTLRIGSACVHLENHGDKPLLARVERSSDRQLVTTAGEIQSFEIFRELFPEQVLTAEKLITVTTCSVIGIRFFEIDQMASAEGEIQVQQQIRNLTRELKILANEMLISGDSQLFVFEKFSLGERGHEALIKTRDTQTMKIKWGAVIAESGELLIGFEEKRRQLFGPVLREVSRQLSLVEPHEVITI